MNILQASTVLLLASSAGAVAAPINDFNLIALGDVTGTSEVEGRAFVGGDVSGNVKNFATMAPGLLGPVGTSGLVASDGLVVGSQLLGGVNVNNGGNVRVAGADSGSIVNANGGGSVTFNDAGVATITNDVLANVAAAGAYFDSFTADSIIDSSDFNNLVFNSTPGADGIAVFDMPASFLTSRNGGFDLQGDLSADLFLIRVSGSNLTASNALNPLNNEFGQDAFQERVVFYFPDATFLHLNALGGSVFAPDADLTNTSILEGTVVANNVILNGEIHLPTTTVVVPEPTSTAALATGGLLALRRSRARR